MRIPFLILCLAVVYGACQTHGVENVDVATNIHDDGDYKVNYANVPLENLLARHKRFSPLAAMTFPLDQVLSIFGFKDGVITTTVNFVKFMTGALAGQDVCSKVELSCGSITKAVMNPLATIQTIVCYLLQGIGSAGRGVMSKGFELGTQFFWTVFLPGLHTTLNTLLKVPFLPPQIRAMIIAFNAIYAILKFTGKVP